jgi:hypothetical protein
MEPRPYFDKKPSNVQVEGGGKTGGFPARNLIFQDVKKVDGGFWPGRFQFLIDIQAISIFLFILFYFFIDKYSNLYYHIVVDAYKVGSAVNLTS